MADDVTTLRSTEDNQANHVSALTNRCRVDADIIRDEGRAISKLKFKEEFMFVFGEDIDKDMPQVHPNLLCDRHARFFRRYNDAKKNKRSFSTGSDKVYSFKPHAEGCWCTAHQTQEAKKVVGRPKKKQRVQVEPKVTIVSATPEVNVDALPMPSGSKLTNLDKDERLSLIKNLCQTSSTEERAFMANMIGKLQSESFAKEAESLEGKYTDSDFLSALNLSNYLSSMDNVTQRYFDGLCGVTPGNQKESYMTAHVMEILYKMKRKNLVAPLCFLHNLDTYAVTGSRLCLDNNSIREPSGTYNTILNWLNNRSSLPPMCPDGDILCVFDNDQVIGKTYYIHPDSKVKSSVITNCAWLVIDKDGNLQKRSDLMPKSWINSPFFVSKVANIRNGNSEMYETLDKVHYDQLYQFLSSAVHQVLAEQELENGSAVDHIDKDIARTPSNQPPSSTVKFRDLSQGRQQSSTEYERFAHVEANHPDEIPLVKVTDPIFVNPNSLDNVALILRKIGTDCGITRYGGVKRQWLVVVCDGLPYTLALKVIKETKVCNFCGKSFLGDEKLEDHFKVTHPNESVQFYFEFDWVILKIGGGHYEMNMMKSFFELNWVPFLSQFSKIYGFKTERAQNYAKACKDNHKAWYMMLAFHIGSMNELVLPYVRKCLLEGTKPTVESFLSQNKAVKSPNYLYLQEQVFTYSQAVINMRMGTCRNNVALIYSAKHSFRGLFHGRRHDKYQMIELYESLHNELFPTDLRSFIDKCQSMSKSGDRSKGQDFDFILEEINKTSKSWIPKGVPSQKNWLTVCRNMDDLEALRKTQRGLLGKSESTSGIRNPDLIPCVTAWRKYLRVSGYLNKENFCSITGENLDGALSNFTELSLSKRFHLINDVFLDIECEPVIHCPVFVTTDERQKYLDIRNKTKNEIGLEIERALLALDDGVKSLYESKLRQVKSKTKAKYLDLYFELEGLLREISSEQEVQDENELHIETETE